MGRGAAWPPNSFGEWVVGQNFKRASRRPSGQTQILKVSLSEDEASGDETLQITYPGRRKGSSSIQHATPEPSSSRKKVSFDGGRKPLKSALKKQAMSPSGSSDTLVEDNSEDDATTEKDESSAIEESDTSEDEVWVKKKKPKADRRPKSAPMCKKETESGDDSSAVKDALPHETCDCKDCVKGRRILKAMIKLDAKHAKGKGFKDTENEKQEGKQKGTKKKAEATSVEASETTETEATEEDKEPSSKQKKKKGQPKEKEEKPSPNENRRPSPKTAEPKPAVDKTAFKLPTYPESMAPNLIMPIKSKVVQCEHTIEGPNDPKPNAFIDSGKGIVRIYHGPVWGNHTGELYGAVNPCKLSPLPPSARPHLGYPHNWAGPQNYENFPPYHPPYPPYPPFPLAGPSPHPHQAAPPKRTPTGQNATAGQPPGGTTANRLGLSGIQWPMTPPMLREHQAREKEKERSEATNNVGPSNANFPHKHPQTGNVEPWASGGNQGWGNDGSAKGGDNAWGQTSGGDGEPKEFDLSFLRGEDTKFERPSNKSVKGSPNGGWDTGGGDNWNQQGGNPSGDTAWGGQSGNTGWQDPSNSGWNDTGGKAANGNQNWGSGSLHGSQGNANNGQGWNQQGSRRNSPQWGNANTGQGWNTQGSTHNSPHGGNTWGGPPGSKPASQHSRPPSNADGGTGHAGWATGHGNNNSNNNGLVGNMPGSWDNNAGTQSRKHSGSHQPPQGWNHHGHGNSPAAGTNGGHGWDEPSAPQGPSFFGHGGRQSWGGNSKGASQGGNWNAGGGGPGGGWDEDPSNNAGPTANSWEANLAGDTKGAATNW